MAVSITLAGLSKRQSGHYPPAVHLKRRSDGFIQRCAHGSFTGDTSSQGCGLSTAIDTAKKHRRPVFHPQRNRHHAAGQPAQKRLKEFGNRTKKERGWCGIFHFQELHTDGDYNGSRYEISVSAISVGHNSSGRPFDQSTFGADITGRNAPKSSP